MECKGCKKPASVHVTVIEKGVRKGEDHWCLDCAPRGYISEVAVKEAKAMNAWVEEQEKWIAQRTADGKVIPSWRVFSRMSFHKGVTFGRENPADPADPRPLEVIP